MVYVIMSMRRFRMETRALEVTNVRVTDNYGYCDVFLCLPMLAIVFKASTLLFIVVKRYKTCFQLFKKASVMLKYTLEFFLHVY